MFVYPSSTALHRVVPKTKIYAHATASKRLKALFAAQVGEITWAHKLSPETLRLPARDGIEEIQVFSLALKSPDLDPAILQLIDRAIPFPLLFELVHGDTIRFAVAYKRPSAADAKKWVIEGTFQTESRALSVPRTSLPVAVDLARLHEQLLRAHIPLRARSGEAFQVLVERHKAVSGLRVEIPRLETRLAREKQFNRKVEINAVLRRHQAELKRLLA
jgi:hypothetical protein